MVDRKLTPATQEAFCHQFRSVVRSGAAMPRSRLRLAANFSPDGQSALIRVHRRFPSLSLHSGVHPRTLAPWSLLSRFLKNLRNQARFPSSVAQGVKKSPVLSAR